MLAPLHKGLEARRERKGHLSLAPFRASPTPRQCSLCPNQRTLPALADSPPCHRPNTSVWTRLVTWEGVPSDLQMRSLCLAHALEGPAWVVTATNGLVLRLTMTLSWVCGHRSSQGLPCLGCVLYNQTNQPSQWRDLRVVSGTRMPCFP